MSEKSRKYLYAFELVVLAGPSILLTALAALVGLIVGLIFIPIGLFAFVLHPTTTGTGAALAVFIMLGASSAFGVAALAVHLLLSKHYLTGDVARLHDNWPLYLACLAFTAVPFAFLGLAWSVVEMRPTGFLDGNVYRDVFLYALPILIPLAHLGIEIRFQSRFQPA